MTIYKCNNGKYRIDKGKYMYKTKSKKQKKPIKHINQNKKTK